MIDLHIHTTATPDHATWTPGELAAAAATRGLVAIAAADHNTTASVRALQAAGKQLGVRVISGVEIDSAAGGKLWHTLVYGVPPDDPALLLLCQQVFERNAADAQALLAELPRQGFALNAAGGPELDHNLDRPPNVAEVAVALAAHNDLPERVPGEDDKAAGMRYLLTRMPDAYNPLGVDAVIAVAHRLGGIAVLAHPGRSQGIYAIPATAEDIAALVELGLDGLEVYYPAHTAEQQAFYRDLAQQHGLLISGGSDSHHPHEPLATVDRRLVTVLERVG